MSFNTKTSHRGTGNTEATENSQFKFPRGLRVSNRRLPRASVSILAFLAALAFIGCPAADDGEDGIPLTGTVQIMRNGAAIGPTNLAVTGDTLFARYSGTETVTLTYQWKVGDKKLGDNSPYYPPEDPGSYTVTISAPGYQSKTSAAVDVGGSPLPDLPGTLSVTVNGAAATTAQTGQELTAVYSGDEAVNYRWYKDDVALGASASPTATTYTPIEAGSYTVKVSMRNFRTLVSAAVAVSGESLILITFDLGDEALDNPTKYVVPGAPIGALPAAPARDGFTLVGWINEEKTTVTETTTFKEASTVYARWSFAGGTPYIDTETNTLVHKNPLMEKNSAFAGDISTEDGTISYTAGAFMYKFPTTVGGVAVNISDYAYFIVKFTLKSATGNVSGVILKQYNNGTNYAGVIEYNGSANVYPWLSNNVNNGLRFPVTGAGTTGGFGMQYNGKPDDVPTANPIEVRITDITFYKVDSHTVSFDLDGGTGTATAITLLEGEALGSKLHAAPTKNNYTFVGWKNAAGDRVTAVTPITGDWTLKAQWALTSSWGTGWTEFITTTATSAPVYVFPIPSDDTLADYDRIVVSIKSDAGVTVAGRLRAWGVYALSGFTFTATPTRPDMGNAAATKLLTSPGLDSFNHTTGTWVEYTLPFNNIASTTTDTQGPAKDWTPTATGNVAIAFGVIAPSGGAGQRLYYVKDIKLTNAAGDKSVDALRPDDSSIWSGGGASAYVTQASSAAAARQILPPDADD